VRKPTSSKMQDFMPKIGRDFIHISAEKGIFSMQKQRKIQEKNQGDLMFLMF
jgi:hypothetical protein